MRKLGLWLVGGLLVSCATAPAPEADATIRQHHVVTRAEPSLPDREWVARHAEGVTSGRVTELIADAMLLEPFEAGADLVEFHLTRRFPVFEDPGESTTGLGAGDDVRVFYREGRDGVPEVLGVEKLPPAEADALRDAVEPCEPPAAPREQVPADRDDTVPGK